MSIPAVVTIPDLPAGTSVTGTELFEAVQTSGGVGNSVKMTLSQMLSTAVGALPAGGTASAGQFLQSQGSGFLASWANIAGNVLASTGLAQSGSTTVSLSLASTAGLSVLGVGGTGSAVPAAIAGTSAQVLRVNDAGNAVAFGAVNLGSTAAVTGVLPGANYSAVNLAASGAGGVQGVLPVPNGGTNTSTLTQNGLVYGNGAATVDITAQGGASSVLIANSGAPSWTATPTVGQLTIAPTVNTLSTGLTINQTASGTFTTTINYNFNSINIGSDSANLSTNFGVGLECLYTFGGSSMQGGRTAISGNAGLATTSSSTNANRNYVGVVGLSEALVNDNGVGTANASAAGAVFGGNFVGNLASSAATAFLNVSGAEFNTQVVQSATVWAKTLAQFSSLTGDKTQGAGVDAMLWLYNQSTSNPGWNNGILFDGTNNPWPISTTGTIIKSLGSNTAAVGIDFSATSFATAAIKSKNFTVDGLGNLNATTYQLGGLTFALFDANNFYVGNRPSTGFSFITDINSNNFYRANTHFWQSPTGVTTYGQIASSGGLTVGTTTDAGTGNVLVTKFFNSAGGFKRVTGNVNVATTTFQTVTGLSVTLATGGNYLFETLHVTNSGSTGGVKVNYTGTITVNNFLADIEAFQVGSLVAGTSIGSFGTGFTVGTAVTTASVYAAGAIEVANGGTFVAQLAQQASTTANTVALRGSYLKVFQVT